jgi:hypothetical protein
LLKIVTASSTLKSAHKTSTVSFGTAASYLFGIGLSSMAPRAPASLPAASQPSRTAGNGTIPVESLTARVTRLEDLIASLEYQLSVQLRRTGEIQAQLDRAINDRRLR